MSIAEHMRAIGEHFRALGDELERLEQERARANESEFYSCGKHGQLPAGLTPRRFLEAARRGEFPSSKRGRVVFARRADVDRWISEGQRDIKPANDSAPRALVETVLSRMPKVGGHRG